MNKVRFSHSFAFKLSLYIITSVIVIFQLVLLHNYHVAGNIIMENITEYAQTLGISTNREISRVLSGAQQISKDMACLLEYGEFTEKELSESLRSVVAKNDNIYGCSISFEPYLFDKTKCYFSSCFYKPGGIVESFPHNEEYDYFKWDWYTIPKKMGNGVWSEPYIDETNANILMVSYSEPFYKTINGKRTFCGVVSSDVDLSWLRKVVTDIKTSKTGYAFILSSKGVFIEHKNGEYTKLKESIFSLAEKRKDAKLKELGKKMVSNQTGFQEYYSYTLKEECFVSYTPLKEMGWSIGVVFPENELFSELNTVTWKLFIVEMFGYVLILLLIIILASKITTPLRDLANASYKIGEGDFNAALPSNSSKDEVGMLNRSFRSMRESLITYIANLKETTAAKEKIEKELSIARDIQQSLLPHKFPSMKQLDLYATLIPAKEVGGDLYDFFFIDEKHLCFAIGDVSGKGVPAALFMAVAKTLLRAKMDIATMDPAKVLNAMNGDLCKENDSLMFVTFFLGILNIETGLLEYCNAGHNPPLIHTANKGFYYFYTQEATHPPLGIIADVIYTGNRLRLLPEDIFFLYTDGVTEAMNINDTLFSEEKLIDVLTKNKDETVLNLVNNVKVAIDQHVSGAIQSDDITMLVLKYNG